MNNMKDCDVCGKDLAAQFFEQEKPVLKLEITKHKSGLVALPITGKFCGKICLKTYLINQL